MPKSKKARAELTASELKKIRTANRTDLTQKEKSFIKHYLTHYNAARAYREAGYAAPSVSAARLTAYKLKATPIVAAEINRQEAERFERLDITADKVLQELANLAFSNMADYCSWDEKGIKIVDSESLSRAQTAAIIQITEKTKKSFSSGTTKEVTVKINPDKAKALLILADYTGILSKAKEEAEKLSRNLFTPEMIDKDTAMEHIKRITSG